MKEQSIAKFVRNPYHRLVPPYFSLLEEASWEKYGFRCVAAGVKSPMMSGLARELYEHNVPFVVIDPQGHYRDLGNLQGVVRIVPDEGQWADPAVAALATQPGLVVDLSGLETIQQQSTCAVFLNSLIQAARSNMAPAMFVKELTSLSRRPDRKYPAPSQDHPVILILDRASQLLYPQMEESEAFVAAKTIIKLGRALGVNIMLCFDEFNRSDDAQNPGEVFLNNADVFLDGLPC
ncbi:MAG: hypothetical protein FOGNACKC_06263 [Anaerolineae bacterium]|nr:hypothetical protein [Anaerolineae bacterium]